MKTRLNISGITIDVTRKNVKNINLRVYPSEGKVALSCPYRTRPDKIADFAAKRISWIKKHLDKGRYQAGKNTFRFLNGEKHPVWGVEKELRVFVSKKPQHVHLNGSGTIDMHVKAGAAKHRREKLMEEWYRSELKQSIPGLIEKWEPLMNVHVKEFGVKKMKTRWGTCNIRDKRIWLNLELAKKDPVCLEFVVVHEMVHLLERLHSKRFYRLMDRFLPGWRESEKLLLS
jgi:predicted metal-dependent hydrolase